MHGEWIVTVAPIGGLAANALSQIASVHILRLQPTLSIIVGSLCGLAATFALILLGLTELSPSNAGLADIWLVDSLTYLALAFGFLTFLNLNITSLRIRMLRAILRAGGAVDKSDLLNQYTPAERLHRRLERLRNAGQIRLEENRWRLSSGQVLAMARCIDGLRLLVLPAQHRR